MHMHACFEWRLNATRACVPSLSQERQLQVLSLSRESILRGMSGVETKYQTVMSQVASTTEQMTLLDTNGQCIHW